MDARVSNKGQAPKLVGLEIRGENTLRRGLWTFIFLMTSGLFGCTTPPTSAPQRDFSTSDLLIVADQLPEDWRLTSPPRDEDFSVLGYRDNLGGSTIEYKDSCTSVTHIVAIFPNTRAAMIAYKNHNHTRNRGGRFPITWSEIPEWKYVSPLADQFRVVCKEEDPIQQWEDLCIIEAQYEEFLSIFIYRNNDPSRTLSDLIKVARAVDKQMAEHLTK